MSLTAISNAMEPLTKWVQKHSPEILTAIGIGGFFTAGIWAVKNTPKAIKAIENEKERQNVEKLDTVDTIRVAGKYYIPAVAISIMSTACITGASKINYKRNAALATAYELSTTALKQYQEKTKEVVGPKKEEQIQNEVSKEAVQLNPPTPQNVILTGLGETLFMDSLTGRYFKSDMDVVRKAADDFNKSLRSGMDTELEMNYFYMLLNLDETPAGRYLGQKLEKGFLELEPTAVMYRDIPCVVLNYDVYPMHTY